MADPTTYLSRFVLEIGSVFQSNVALTLLGVALLAAFLQLFRTWWWHRSIPGPLLASVTNFPRTWWVLTKRAHIIHQEMHEKYGELIRIGPNAVMFSNPEAIPTVYITKPGFVKVPTERYFYFIFDIT
jgi:hypothetical protein